MFHRYYRDGWNSANDRYYNHGNSAIAQAGFAKGTLAQADGDNDYLYTIALGAGEQGTNVLSQMASPGKAYATNDPTQLTPIFEEIAEAIGSAAKNATVSDPMARASRWTLAPSRAYQLRRERLHMMIKTAPLAGTSAH